MRFTAAHSSPGTPSIERISRYVRPLLTVSDVGLTVGLAMLGRAKFLALATVSGVACVALFAARVVLLALVSRV